MFNVAYRTLLIVFYFVDFNGMFIFSNMVSENACALQSQEKYYFSKQNITSNILQIK